MNPTGSNKPKWPVAGLAVGQSLLIPWLTDSAGRRLLDQKVLHISIWRYAKKSGISVRRDSEVWGVRVTRIA